MKKLFALRDTRTNKLVAGLFFPSKKPAKQARDEYNAALPAPAYVVTSGPDHWKSK